MMEEANNKFDEVKTEVDKVLEKVEKLIESKAADEEDPLKAFEEADTQVKKSSSSVEELQAMLKSRMLNASRAHKGTFNELRTLLMKVEAKVVTLDKSCKKTNAGLKALRQSIEASAHEAIMRVVKKHLE